MDFRDKEPVLDKFLPRAPVPSHFCALFDLPDHLGRQPRHRLLCRSEPKYWRSCRVDIQLGHGSAPNRDRLHYLAPVSRLCLRRRRGRGNNIPARESVAKQDLETERAGCRRGPMGSCQRCEHRRGEEDASHAQISRKNQQKLQGALLAGPFQHAVRDEGG